MGISIRNINKFPQPHLANVFINKNLKKNHTYMYTELYEYSRQLTGGIQCFPEDIQSFSYISHGGLPKRSPLCKSP